MVSANSQQLTLASGAGHGEGAAGDRWCTEFLLSALEQQQLRHLAAAQSPPSLPVGALSSHALLHVAGEHRAVWPAGRTHQAHGSQVTVAEDAWYHR